MAGLIKAHSEDTENDSEKLTDSAIRQSVQKKRDARYLKIFKNKKTAAMKRFCPALLLLFIVFAVIKEL